MNENIYEIALIGAGQLGSRHLQGLVHASLPRRIYVVDPSNDSLKTAKQRAEEVSPVLFPKEISYHQSFSELPPTLDLAIIATSSLVRLKALKELMKYSNVKNLILEKILFTTEDEFNAAKELIGSTPAWVNCPRRLNEFYTRLHSAVQNSNGPMRYVIAGRGFGLACNSIHFIDIFSMLCGEVEYELDTSKLIPKIFPSKRDGYIELFGRLVCNFSGGNVLEFDCLPVITDKADYYVRLEGDGFCIIVDEIRTSVEIILDDNDILDDFQFKRVFLSTATGKIAEDILRNGTSPLTPFSDSVKLHLPLIKGLTDFVKKSSGKSFTSLNIT